MTDTGSRATGVLDLVVIGAGAVGFLSSLFPWYSSSASVFGFGGSVSVNAWDAGPSAWLAVLLLTGAGIVALVAVVSPARSVPTWLPLLPAVLTTIAALSLLARWVSWSNDDNSVNGLEGARFSGSWLGGLVEASAGPEPGFYVALVAVLVGLVASWLAARRTSWRP
ncbi:MAG TPA: hypothetical protein VL595_27825 [Pseudonocardia sp.]|nr:hypothetical protein [Pseudonocardia sp.]